MEQHFDLLVIGGGSGGMATARRAASYGARVALVERSRLGGTCVNVGCVPKKVMWNAAHTADALHRAADYGFQVGPAALDWGELKSRRDAYIRRLNGIYGRNIDKAGITLLEGDARLVDARTVEVAGARYTASHILVATGGRPSRPDIPGQELGIDSDGFFELAEQPRRVAVVGAGYIAVELAGVLHHLGTQADLVVRREAPLRSFDPLIRDSLLEAMEQDGITVQTHSVPKALERADDGTLTLELEDGRHIGGYDQVIWAIGRDLCTDGLGLEAAGVERNGDGSIPVNAYQETNIQGIYAVGDIIGHHPLTPVAIAAGRRLADRLFGGQADRHLDYQCVPTVVFSHPPIGTVGLTEPEAREQYGEEEVEVFTTRFVAMDYAMGDDKRRSAMKLVTVGDNRRVVGAHLFGVGSDEMLQGFAVAIRMGATKQDLDDTVAIHPTAAEELVTLPG